MGFFEVLEDALFLVAGVVFLTDVVPIRPELVLHALFQRAQIACFLETLDSGGAGNSEVDVPSRKSGKYQANDAA